VAIGLDVVRGDDSAPAGVARPPRWRTAGVVAAVGATGVVVWLARHGHAPAADQTHVAVFALVTSGVLLVRLGFRGARSATTAVLLAAIVTADLWGSLRPQPVAYSPDAVAAWETYAPEYRSLADRAGPDRVWVYGGLANLQPKLASKLATRYGVRAIDDYEPLVTRRQAEYFTFFMDGTPAPQRWPFLFAGGVELPSEED